MRMIRLERSTEKVEQRGDKVDIRESKSESGNGPWKKESDIVHTSWRSIGLDCDRLRELEGKCECQRQKDVRLTSMQQRKWPRDKSSDTESDIQQYVA